MAALGNPIADGFGRHGDAKRQAVGDRLRQTEDVGDDVLAAEGEDRARAESRLDLVADQEDAVRVAAFPDAFQIAGGGYPDAALALDGLRDHGDTRVALAVL